jgi:hypothetical protein
MNNEQMAVVLGTVAMEPKGEYDPSTYYEKLNVVSYNGSTYIATQPSQGIAPTNTGYWQFISSAGLSEADVVDNLESTATNKPLSAKQGKVLNDNFTNSLKDNYYEEITVRKARYHDTDCYITTIPMNDSSGNPIVPYIADGNGKSPTEYARDNYTTITINATLGLRVNGSASTQNPSVIANGEIIRQNDILSGVPDNILYVGIKANREFVEYQLNETTAQEMLEDGCLQVFDVFWKLVDNGEAVDLTNVIRDDGVNADAVRGPRQTLGVKADGTIIILTNDGRTDANQGLFSHEQQEIMIELGCVNAWNLDGGGSTSTTYKGTKVNRNIDGGGTSDRKIRYTLNFKKEIKNEQITKLYSQIGQVKQDLLNQILPDTTVSKVSVVIPIKGRNLSGEQKVNDYYHVGLDRILGNEYSLEHIDIEKENSETTIYTLIKIKKIGYFKVTSNVELICREIQNNRINVYRTSNNYVIPGSEIGASSTLETANRVELVNTAFINNRNIDETYLIRIDTKDTSTLVSSGCIFVEEM